MKILKAGVIGSWLNFKYEKLPTFCFFCGVIGHSDKFCEKLFYSPYKSVEKLFGIWLRDPSRRSKNVSGERWLRSKSQPAISKEKTEVELSHLPTSMKRNQCHDGSMGASASVSSEGQQGMGRLDIELRGKKQ